MTEMIIAEAMDLFLSRISIRVAPRTVDDYKYSAGWVMTAFRLAGLEATPILQITLDDLERVVAVFDMEPFSHFKPNTLKRFVVFIKMLFAWLHKRRYILGDPSTDLEYQRTYPDETQPFSLDEVRAILDKIPSGSSEFRDLAMWCLALETGLRISEECDLMLEDYVGEKVFVQHGKGGKSRTISVGKEACRVIDEYIRLYRPTGKDNHLFLTLEGEKMTVRTVQKRLELWSEKCGVMNSHFHRFRATFATQYAIRSGGDLIGLQLLLGHSTLDMSRRYVKMGQAEQARFMNRESSLIDTLSLNGIESRGALVESPDNQPIVILPPNTAKSVEKAQAIELMQQMMTVLTALVTTE